MNRLQGKIALVTGAAQGIGAAICRAFIANGATVWLTDLRDASELAVELGPSARFTTLDVREEDDWATAIDTLIARDGRLDILVNNAGITGLGGKTIAHDPENATLEAWREVHRTNLDGVFLGCRAAIRAMRAQGQGSIINVSSRSGLVGTPAAAAYASSKAGVRNHSKSVALWCAQQGLAIRCNSIHPGAIMTEIWKQMLGDGEDREPRMAAMAKGIPLRRFGKPEEVAAMALFLASDEAAYVTGSEFTIDGGLLAGSAVPPGRRTRGPSRLV